jgi:hypothetical protein
MKLLLPTRFALALTVIVSICTACNQQDKSTPSAATKTETNSAPTVDSLKETNAAPVMISAQEAKNHVGETAVVTGNVVGIHVTQKGDVFLNIGGAFPNQPFTAVCFQGAIPSDDLKKFVGKTVKVKGKIKDYNGQIEIVLEKADQISE